MADAVGVTLIKTMTYRADATEEYSNQYWLTGAVPADATAWKALADALIAQEKLVYPSVVVVVRAYGYDSDLDTATAVWSWDYAAAGTSVPGTFAPGANPLAPGDGACWVRWKTSRLNTKGKAIFLRKYFHPAVMAGSDINTHDNVMTAQKTALAALGTKLRDGTFLDGRTITARGQTDTIVSSAGSTYVTTRTLKRRGKRPGA